MTQQPHSLTLAVNYFPLLARQNCISFIQSYFFNADTTTLDTVVRTIPFPFILKPQGGAYGRGVALIQNDDPYKHYMDVSVERNLIAEHYLSDIKEEFRTVVIRGKGIGAIRKNRTPSELISFDSDLDADEAVDDPEVISFAEKAALLGGGDVYGADIARTISGKLYLIENNRCPNFITFREATGIKVEEKIVDFLLQTLS